MRPTIGDSFCVLEGLARTEETNRGLREKSNRNLASLAFRLRCARTGGSTAMTRDVKSKQGWGEASAQGFHARPHAHTSFKGEIWLL